MKRNIIKAAAVLAAAFMLGSALAACTGPANGGPDPADTQAPASEQPTEESTVTEEPIVTAAPTPEPTIPPNVLYGGNNTISSPTKPRPGETALMGCFRDHLDQAERDGNVFAVKLMIEAGHEASEQLQAWRSSTYAEGVDPFTAREQAYYRWVSERFSDPEENRKFVAFVEGSELGEEAIKDVMFDDYWRKNAPEEAEAYDEASAAWQDKREELLGDAVRAEAARMQELGLIVQYEHGAYMTGYLTSDQIRNFPAGTEHGFYIYWQFDPELTAEKVEEMLNSEW
jgi:hypothetical protein